VKADGTIQGCTVTGLKPNNNQGDHSIEQENKENSGVRNSPKPKHKPSNPSIPHPPYRVLKPTFVFSSKWNGQ
jgi:hypothetical protein